MFRYLLERGRSRPQLASVMARERALRHILVDAAPGSSGQLPCSGPVRAQSRIHVEHSKALRADGARGVSVAGAEHC